MPPQRFAFTFTHAGAVLAQFELEAGEYVLGRADASEIAIDLEGIALSHARLKIGSEVAIEDCETDDGTFIDGRRVTTAQQLLPGCPVTFGTCLGILELQTPPLPLPERRSARKKEAKRKALADAPDPALALKAELETLRSLQQETAAALAREREERQAAERELREEAAGLAQTARVAYGEKQAAQGEVLELNAALEQRRTAFLQEERQRQDEHRREVEELRREVAGLQEEHARLAQAGEPLGAAAIRKAKEHTGLIAEANKVLQQKLAATAETARQLEQIKKELKQREHALVEALVRRQTAEEHCLQMSRELTRKEEAKGATVKSGRRYSAKKCLALVALMIGAISGVLFLAHRGNSAMERAQASEAVVARLQSIGPQLHRQTLDLVRQRRFEEGLHQINYALAVQPRIMDYHLLRAHIAEALLRLDVAVAAFEAALALDPNQPEARENLALCRSILQTRTGAVSMENRYALHRRMLEQERWPEALRVAQSLGADRVLLHRTWRAVLAHAGLGAALTLNDDGSFDLDLRGMALGDLSVLRELPLRALDLSKSDITDLSSLSGVAIRRLDLSGTRVRDLQPLAKIPLERLNLSNSEVTNLFPLAGLPLKELVLEHTQVSDLSALRGLPLETLRAAGAPIWNINPLATLPLRTLDLARTRVAEITALKHLPLRELHLDDTRVADLRPLEGASLELLTLSRTLAGNVEPLRNCPLKELRLAGCAQLASLEPLAACTDLERLVLPAQCKKVAFLRNLPSLRFLAYDQEGADPSPIATAQQFWLAADRAIPVIQAGR